MFLMKTNAFIVVMGVVVMFPLILPLFFSIKKSFSSLSDHSIISVYLMKPMIGIIMSMFVLLSMLNFLSLNIYSYPVTTSMGFNLNSAMTLWSMSLLLMIFKMKTMSFFMPENAPKYLAPLLALIETSSFLIRPITLCFRLLANLSAGHVLLTLMSKIWFLLWMSGTIFMTLELVVCLVQAFVFTMLSSVYIEEGLTHYIISYNASIL